jgi:hypothetical protein
MVESIAVVSGLFHSSYGGLWSSMGRYDNVYLSRRGEDF